MKRCIRALILVAALISWAGVAGAEGAKYLFELTPMGGWHMFEGNQNLDDGYTYGVTLGIPLSARWTLEGGFSWIDSETEVGDVDVEGQRYGLDLLFHFRPGSDFRPFVLVGGGALRLSPDGGTKDTDEMANYGAGIKYALMPDLDLRAEVRHVMPFDDFYHNLVAQLGLTLSFGKRQAPTKMGPGDSDGDGVTDDMDACPATPAGFAVDSVGCPMVVDADGDGVTDEMDLCPGTPPGVAVGDRGCPRDTDGDGIPDSADRCPNSPAGAPVDESGCPLVLDADKDGVKDSMDRCPDTPVGAKVDKRGCWVIKGLTFDSGKSAIKPEFNLLLGEVVQILKANPKVRVAIEGYTDSMGGEAGNQRISEARAKAVHDELVSRGIAKERLEYRGFGEKNPVADNTTDEGRKKNRRVELRPL